MLRNRALINHFSIVYAVTSDDSFTIFDGTLFVNDYKSAVVRL